ncbi:hypothetical protein FDC22_02895 [Clostridium botulinum]|uniref:Uncharacterized protein n=1 Tax=Clostridium botulinum (strain Okra / Type B1) TaxID=498213 RepID=B1IEN8_CLOBK|nr:hypothetical protein [Clostridium botulinum]EKX80699.1 hypothetical protein CFSAN001628_004902 [Clostridium botulinum CFSAN001628]ACA44903.1 hypothetical protein CLD_0059 [Clostridium botulinum B1 str. Okra]MBD5561573.1 hypothetical protein [Clostridium botulinum]MBD5565242.1 hypothetical protein [Clostridium botulinum]MBD5570755.1 hypothetical protein [Clostridium botulinum]
MIEIAYFKEEKLIQKLPLEVQVSIRKILKILDDEYGKDRDKYEDDGGYVVVIEKKEDFKELEDKAYIDCNKVIAEYVDKIVCSSGEVYTNSLIICNNAYNCIRINTTEFKRLYD